MESQRQTLIQAECRRPKNRKLSLIYQRFSSRLFDPPLGKMVPTPFPFAGKHSSQEAIEAFLYYRAAYYLTAAGTEAVGEFGNFLTNNSYPRALDLWEHFLYGSGRPYYFKGANIYALIQENIAKGRYTDLLLRATQYLDKACDGKYNFHSTNVAITETADMDWSNALHGFETWAKAAASVKGKRIEMIFVFSIHDFYDWNRDIHPVIYSLQCHGVGTVFDIRGDLHQVFIWQRGNFSHTKRRVRAW